MSPTTVEIRMYNVGFGDAFRVTVRGATQTWRMLVDCGVHSQGAARPIRDSVDNIIADLCEDCGPQPPHLDVVVATHHHQDHISGFAEDRWSTVDVGEVWVPFVEDRDDPDANALRRAQTASARQLEGLIAARRARLTAREHEAAEMLDTALAFAVNSRGNEKATDRLLSRNGTTFANRPTVRYLADKQSGRTVIDVGKCGVVAHVLGPPRDPAMLKKMDPPRRAGWLTLDGREEGGRPEDSWRLFNAAYVIDDPRAVPPALLGAQAALRLHDLTNDMGLLTAASVLEQSVNNTSVFFVLDVSGLRLLFPGDAQHGAWEHVRTDPASRALIEGADFYKVGHHGSHNATPKQFVLDEWNKPGEAMVPWGLVERWKSTIPKKELLDALSQKQHRVILPVEVREGNHTPNSTLVEQQWWSELQLAVPV
jgi:beta-lactamase superfamily II metal-dependent hydrolase